MTFCQLPDQIDLSGEEWDATVVEQLRNTGEKKKPVIADTHRDEIHMNKAGQAGALKKALGPQVIKVPVARQPTPDEKKIWEEVNEATRDLTFFTLRVAGQQYPRVRQWRQELENSHGVKTLLGQRFSICNANPTAQLLTLVANSFVKTLTKADDDGYRCKELHLRRATPTVGQRDVAHARQENVRNAGGS